MAAPPWGKEPVPMLGRYLRPLVPRPVARADLALFRAVARTHPPALDVTLPRLGTAANHSKLWLAVSAALLARGGRPGRRAALRGMGAIAVTSAIANLPAKLLTARARPDIDIVPEARRLARIPTSTSFPSGHSASAAAFATAVALELPQARWPLGLLAGGVAFSRIYTGVHYPGDVVAGVALGTGVALASRRVWPLPDPAPARGATLESRARPGRDGEGLVIVANSQAGPALLPDPAARLARELPAATVVEVDEADGLGTALGDACHRGRALGIAGGDGSVSAAAARAHAEGLPLVVVPAGTLNRLASDLGLADVDDAVAAVRDGELVAMDVAEIDGHAFVNAASLGLYSELVDLRERLETRIGKWPATLVALARTLRSAQPLDLELDGQPQRIWLLFAGNGRYTAPGIAPTHRRRLDEGVLDVRVIRADRRWSRTRIVLATLLGRLDRSVPFEARTVRELAVRAREPLRVACDGETFTGRTSFRIRKRERPLALLVPAGGPEAQRWQ